MHREVSAAGKSLHDCDWIDSESKFSASSQVCIPVVNGSELDS